MKQVIIGSVVALGLGVVPVLAESTDTGKNAGANTTHEQETIHAPTNRVGEMVPTMTAPDAEKQKRSDDKGESVHAPTNRVGKEVPTMTGPEQDDQ